MAFQDDPEFLHSLNISHVIVTSDPTAPMLKYYNTCLKAIKGDLAKGTKKRKGLWASLDEVNEQTKHLTDEEVDDWLDEKYGRFAQDDIPDDDSSTSNVIKFRPKRHSTLGYIPSSTDILSYFTTFFLFVQDFFRILEEKIILYISAKMW